MVKKEIKSFEPNEETLANASGGKGFMENYRILHETAQKLKEQTEPNLDTLIELVDEGLAAYKGCEERIKSVQALLEQRLSSISEE